MEASRKAFAMDKRCEVMFLFCLIDTGCCILFRKSDVSDTKEDKFLRDWSSGPLDSSRPYSMKIPSRCHCCAERELGLRRPWADWVEVVFYKSKQRCQTNRNVWWEANCLVEKTRRAVCQWSDIHGQVYFLYNNKKNLYIRKMEANQKMFGKHWPGFSRAPIHLSDLFINVVTRYCLKYINNKHERPSVSLSDTIKNSSFWIQRLDCCPHCADKDTLLVWIYVHRSPRIILFLPFQVKTKCYTI